MKEKSKTVIRSKTSVQKTYYENIFKVSHISKKNYYENVKPAIHLSPPGISGKFITSFSQYQPEKGYGRERGGKGTNALCGRLGEALRSDAYVGFREGQLTLANHSRS